MDVSVYILTLVLLWTDIGRAMKIHILHWNTTNPLFRIDNTDHIIDVNRGNQFGKYDQVHIICPNYDSRTANKEKIEKHIIYSVTKEEYESCTIKNPKPRVIAQCTKPNEFIYFTITFRSFTPTPGGMEFTPGTDYFFISTSDKTNLFGKVGGACSSHNMKVQFKVADNVSSSSSRARRKQNKLNVPRDKKVVPGRPMRTNDSGSKKEDSGEKLPMHYGDLSYFSNTNHENIETNELIKHEASRMARAGTNAAGTRILSAGKFNFIVVFVARYFIATAMRRWS